MSRYAVLKLLKTKEELEKHGYGFIYEECQEDALNLWYDIGDDNYESQTGLTGKKKKIDIAIIIYGRLFIERAKAYVNGEDALIDEKDLTELY